MASRIWAQMKQLPVHVCTQSDFTHVNRDHTCCISHHRDMTQCKCTIPNACLGLIWKVDMEMRSSGLWISLEGYLSSALCMHGEGLLLSGHIPLYVHRHFEPASTLYGSSYWVKVNLNVHVAISWWSYQLLIECMVMLFSLLSNKLIASYLFALKFSK